MRADHRAHRSWTRLFVQNEANNSTCLSYITDQGIFALRSGICLGFVWYITVPVVRNSRMVPVRPRIGLDNLCGVLRLRYLLAGGTVRTSTSGIGVLDCTVLYSTSSSSTGNPFGEEEQKTVGSTPCDTARARQSHYRVQSTSTCPMYTRRVGTRTKREERRYNIV